MGRVKKLKREETKKKKQQHTQPELSAKLEEE